MRDVTSTGPTPSRRLVAAGALGAAVALLTGCGIRLEDDAPHVPLVPERSPIEGEDALVRLLAAVQAAALAPTDTKVPISALLAPLHARQATVLHDALRQRGIPADELPSATPSPSASPTTTPTGTQTPSPTVSPSPVAAPTVATVEGSILAAGTGLAAAKADLRATLLSLLAQAHAALDIAGAAPAAAAPTATPSPSATPTSSPTWSHPEALAPLITAVRSTTYFLEVAAARSPAKARTAELPGIAELHALSTELVEAAGDAAPAPELGYPLPHRVETPAETKILTTEALTGLLSTFGAALPSLGENDSDAAFAKVPQWLGTVAAQAHRHGIPLTAFPGLA